MPLAFIALGSNIGDGKKTLQRAWALLGDYQKVTPLAISSPYMSKPLIKSEWQKRGKNVSENWFTNAVAALETSFEPHELLEATSEVESKLGRDREHTVNRTIDLDLIYYDDQVHSDEILTIPHPDMHNRHFVLAPLAELAPDRIHPINGKSTATMIRALPYAGKDEIFKAKWENVEGRE